MSDAAELRRRASDLESQAEEIRNELTGVLRDLAEHEGSDDDTFAMRFAQRMMDERDRAQRRIAELESQLMTANSRDRADSAIAIQDASALRAVIVHIINNPTLPRDQVQARLLTIHERVRDHAYS